MSKNTNKGRAADDQSDTGASIFGDDQPAASAESAPAAAPAIDFDKLRADLAARASGPANPADADDDPDAGTESGGDGFFLDMKKAAEAFKPIAAGTRVLLAVTAAERKVSQSSGNSYLMLRVKVERVVSVPAGVSADDAAMYRNRTIRDNVNFTPPNPVTGSRGTIWRAKRAFDAFGIAWPMREFRSRADFNDFLDTAAEEFIGAVAEAEIGIEDQQIDPATGKPKADPATGEAYAPKNTIARYHKYAGNAIPAAESDDDIPF